jgi:Flp pilus assembly protein TadG
MRGRFLSDENGQAMVEFALVLPILLMVLLGIVDFGRAWNARQVITNAAREGARTTVVSGSKAGPDSVKVLVNNALSSAGLQPTALGSTCTTAAGPMLCVSGNGGSPGTSATVQIAYPYRLQFLAPLMKWTTGQSSITLRTSFVMRNE